MIKELKGKILIPSDADGVWSHEIATAQALAKAGYTVEFLPTSNGNDAKSPDILMDGVKWEIKAPRTVQQFLVQKFKQQKTIKRLLFINRKRETIDISTLV